jgi:hypothetical protein
VRKGVIGLVLVVLLFLLTITESQYVEWGELFIIIGALSLATVIYLKNNGRVKLLVTSAAVGFVLCGAFGVADIVIDHYLYYLPNGKEDGIPLTLAFKLGEFSDDLFVGSIISMCVVLAVTFILKRQRDGSHVS